MITTTTTTLGNNGCDY